MENVTSQNKSGGAAVAAVTPDKTLQAEECSKNTGVDSSNGHQILNTFGDHNRTSKCTKQPKDTEAEQLEMWGPPVTSWPRWTGQ